MSHRGNEWKDFSAKVEEHVENYTVPQYGDFPEDEATQYTEADFITAVQKYARRLGRNARGPEEEKRDLLKIAHYAGMLYIKKEREKAVENRSS